MLLYGGLALLQFCLTKVVEDTGILYYYTIETSPPHNDKNNTNLFTLKNIDVLTDFLP